MTEESRPAGDHEVVSGKLFKFHRQPISDRLQVGRHDIDGCSNLIHRYACKFPSRVEFAGQAGAGASPQVTSGFGAVIC